MRAGNYAKALNELISLINGSYPPNIEEILQGILEIQEMEFPLTSEYLQKIKPLIDDFDENIHELAIKNYIKTIKTTSLLNEELEFVLSKLKSFEPIIKEEMINYLIEVFPNYPEREEEILGGLIECLGDEIWNVRMKIIKFLNDIFMKKIDLIINFKKQLEIILEESDIDVLREGLEFLLKLYDQTYSIADIRKIIKNISEKNWIAQEKILFIIGKLGIKRKDLITPIRNDLIKLLDYNDYLVTKKAQQIIEEIIVHNANLFDETLFSYIRNDTIDNLGAIETLLSNSIIKHGFMRFYSIFKQIANEKDPLFKIFNAIVNKLLDHNSELILTMFNDLINKILKDFNVNDYLKLERLLILNPNYDLYNLLLKSLNDKGHLKGIEEEKRRIDLMSFLWENIPELGFKRISSWLNGVIKHDSIEIEAICEKFNLQHSLIVEVIKKLVKKGLLNAQIQDDVIISEKFSPKPKEDVIFSNKWQVIQENEDDEIKINVILNLRNNSGKQITNISFDIIDPYQILVVQEVKNHFPENLNHNRELSINWILRKYYDISNMPLATMIQILIFYQIKGKLFYKKENMDILLL